MMVTRGLFIHNEQKTKHNRKTHDLNNQSENYSSTGEAHDKITRVQGEHMTSNQYKMQEIIT